MWPVGPPLTSSFYSSTRPSTLTSTQVLVNTGSSLIQAVNDEALRGGGAPNKHVYMQIYIQAGKLQMKLLSPKFP